MSNYTEQDANTTTEYTYWRVAFKASNGEWVGVSEHTLIDEALEAVKFHRKTHAVRLFKVTTTETRIA